MKHYAEKEDQDDKVLYYNKMLHKFCSKWFLDYVTQKILPIPLIANHSHCNSNAFKIE